MSINSFTFDGVSSEEMGLYVGGQKTFGAPQRDVTKVSIPGRNGDLVRDNGRFLNSEIAYNIVAMNDFKETAQNVRNWLMSAKGYKRLEDTYHPEHYRMARVSGGIDFETGAYNATGKTQVIFDCMPQRFLKSGETVISGDPVERSASGEIASFETDYVVPITSAEVSLSPIQSGSGDPSPTNIRPISGHTGAELNIGATYQTAVNTYSVTFPETIYGGSHDFVSGKAASAWGKYTITGDNVVSYSQEWGLWRIITRDVNYGSNNNYKMGLCDRYTMQTSFAGVKDNNNSIGFNSANSTQIIIRDDTITTTNLRDLLNANPIEVVYPLVTSIEYTLTPQQLTTLLGQNVVWGSGPITLTYVEPSVIENPTPFEAKPLIRVYGSGTCTVTINNQIITINNVTDFVDIDCETMNCYNGVVNKNADVVLGAQGFPTLPPGITAVAFGGGVTKVEITPRWWEL